MNIQKLVKKIIETRPDITDIFWAACGGSMNDLFPAHYFIKSESQKIHSNWMPARELTLMNPPTWNEHSITFVLTCQGQRKNVGLWQSKM